MRRDRATVIREMMNTMTKDERTYQNESNSSNNDFREILCDQLTERKVHTQKQTDTDIHTLRQTQTSTYLRKNSLMLSILISSIGNRSTEGGKFSLVLSEPSECCCWCGGSAG